MQVAKTSPPKATQDQKMNIFTRVNDEMTKCWPARLAHKIVFGAMCAVWLSIDASKGKKICQKDG